MKLLFEPSVLRGEDVAVAAAERRAGARSEATSRISAGARTGRSGLGVVRQVWSACQTTVTALRAREEANASRVVSDEALRQAGVARHSTLAGDAWASGSGQGREAEEGEQAPERDPVDDEGDDLELRPPVGAEQRIDLVDPGRYPPNCRRRGCVASSGGWVDRLKRDSPSFESTQSGLQSDSI